MMLLDRIGRRLWKHIMCLAPVGLSIAACLCMGRLEKRNQSANRKLGTESAGV